MKKIETIKVKNEDGTLSNESYYFSVNANNIDMFNGESVQSNIGNLDLTHEKNVAEQLKSLNQKTVELENDIKNSIKKTDVIDNLKSEETKKPLSAKQGKILNDNFDTLSEELEININNLQTNINELNTEMINKVDTSIATKIQRDVSELALELDSKADSTLVTTSINNLQDEINGLANGSPYAANSVADMIDENKIYVNLTDGYWYYYNDSWTRGGVYQSTSIDNSEIEYKHLNIELKNKVNSNFINKKYDYLLKDKLLMDNTHLLQNSQGHDCLRIPCNQSYIIRIKKTTFESQSGAIYKGTYCSGEDSQSYLIRYLRGSFRTNRDQVLLINPFDDDYHYFYIPKNLNFPYYFFNISTINFNIDINDIDVYLYNDLLKEENLKYISNNLEGIDKINTNLFENNLKVRGYCYWSGSSYETGEINGYLSTAARSSFYFLPANKEIYVYTKSSANYIMAYDEDLDYQSYIKITGGEKIIFNNQIYYKKRLSYEVNKIIVGIDILNATSIYNLIISEIEISNSNIIKINNKNIDNNIPIKNWYLFGDSITNKNYRALINYSDWCKNDLNIITHNYAISAQGYKQGANNFTAQLSNLTSYNPETDIITVMGSINDIQHVSSGHLGQLGDKTMDTVYGAMYTFFNTLFTKYVGARVGIISPIISISTHNNETNMLLYIKALKDTANLFNIPVLDIFNNSNLRPWDSNFLTKYYTADGENNTSQVDTGGVHPNSKGHQLFYSKIREFIKTL